MTQTNIAEQYRPWGVMLEITAGTPGDEGRTNMGPPAPNPGADCWDRNGAARCSAGCCQDCPFKPGKTVVGM